MISVKFSSGRGCNIIFRHLTTKTQQTVEPKKQQHQTTTKAIHNCRRTVWFCIFFANFSAALLNGDVPLFRSLVGSLISIQQLHLQVKPPLSLNLLSLLCFCFRSVRVAADGAWGPIVRAPSASFKVFRSRDFSSFANVALPLKDHRTKSCARSLNIHSLSFCFIGKSLDLRHETRLKLKETNTVSALSD